MGGAWAWLAIGLLGAPPERVFEPAPTDRVLLNRGMGLYGAGFSGTMNLPDDPWWAEIVDILYFRPIWSELEPDGPADLRAWFQPYFDEWVTRRGMRVAFRVMSMNVSHGAPYCTPKWVFDRGARSVEHRSQRGTAQTDPVFWDEAYLRETCEFIARLGSALDGRPGLEFVDIGQIGEWGEMHLGLHIPGRWTPAQLEAEGYSEERYVAAYRRIIDSYAAAFRRTPVFLNVGEYGSIADYAALRGMHFRQDGLTPRGPSSDVGRRLYVPYADRGVMGNYEFHSTLEDMKAQGWDLRETVEVGLSVPLSYLNTNILGLRQLTDAPAEVRAILTDAARRIGFRFGLERAVTLARASVGPARAGRLPVTLHWLNRGLAWCHASYAVEAAVLGSDGTPIALGRAYPDPPTTRWSPGTGAVVPILLRVPPGTAPGSYRVAVRMVLPEEPETRLQLDLEQPLADGWHALGTIDLVPGEPLAGEGYRADFETGDDDWRPAAGIAAQLVDEGPGGRCLRLHGTQRGAWNLVGRRVPVRPASRYRLRATMRCAGLEPGDVRPTLKAGLNRADGTWIENHNTNAYDRAAMDTWQTLEVVFETPLDAASADLCVEKGRLEAVGADLLLDDVTLELLEAP